MLNSVTIDVFLAKVSEKKSSSWMLAKCWLRILLNYQINRFLNYLENTKFYH